jgi:hypothetical protein
MENKNQEPVFNLKEMMNEQHESLFEPISTIENTKNEPSVETLQPTFVKKTDCIKDLSECGSSCECLKDVESEPLKEAELIPVKETEPVKEPKKNVWNYLNPLSWRLPKFTK